MKSRKLWWAFWEGVIAAVGAHLGAWGLLVTADRLIYFCGHVVTILIIRLLG